MPDSGDLVAALAGPAETVAPTLLGSVLRHGGVAVRITEVEAYAGTDDPGSHAARGRTRRNEPMFGPPGTLYVYFTYGMHFCANVVCGPVGEPSAVLVRAGEVVDGLGTARTRRPNARTDRDLARGPARLCVALGIGGQYDGTNLARGPVTLSFSAPLSPTVVGGRVVDTGPRVGLRRAADRQWRFWLRGDPTVSNYRPATSRRPPERGEPARFG